MVSMKEYNDARMDLYHGSLKVIIKDSVMASHTYFTNDIEIAKSYGRYVYVLFVDEKIKALMIKDSMNEHWINISHIPLSLFHIIDMGKD